MALIKSRRLPKRGRPTDIPNETPEQQPPLSKRGRRTKVQDKKAGQLMRVPIVSSLTPHPDDPNQPPQPWTLGIFDLPVEVRRQIYEYFIPHGQTIQMLASHAHPPRAYVHEFDAQDKFVRSAPIRSLKIPTALFLVNKLFSNEARALLYGDNRYSFAINCHSHRSTGKSLQSVEIFGLFGRPGCLHLLRDLRSIELVIIPSKPSSQYWNGARLRARLEFFVGVLKEHADDANKRSLLERLKVQIQFAGDPLHIYSFEPLAALRGIKHLQLRETASLGSVPKMPSWFARCLDLCCRGQGGEVKPLEYPQVRVEPKKKPTTKKDKRISARMKDGVEFFETTRQWYQPMLDWGEFAQRNGIEIPEDWCHPTAWA